MFDQELIAACEEYVDPHVNQMGKKSSKEGYEFGYVVLTLIHSIDDKDSRRRAPINRLQRFNDEPGKLLA
jgi:hypothetical protein